MEPGGGKDVAEAGVICAAAVGMGAAGASIEAVTKVGGFSDVDELGGVKEEGLGLEDMGKGNVIGVGKLRLT